MEKSVRLKVTEADQRDVGKGIVRIDEKFRNMLEVNIFDVVELKGERSTSAVVGRSYPQDEGLDVIRMDGLIRTNAKTSLGEYVEVAKAEWKEAKKVILAPVIQNIHIYAPSESLRAIFHNRTVSKGDIISTTSVRRPRESFGSDVMFEHVFQDFFGSSFGLGEIKLHVVSTAPAGIVKITDITEVELLPEAEIGRAHV